MDFSIVVVNFNGSPHLKRCLASLAAQELDSRWTFEVIVVDNASEDDSVAMMARDFPTTIVVANEKNSGFGAACNEGIKKSRGQWVCFLNNDAEAEPSWLAALARATELATDRCGMLQSLMLYADASDVVNSTGIQMNAFGGGRDRDEGRLASTVQESQPIFCPTGGAAAYRRDTLEDIAVDGQYFDGDYFLYSEDVDLGWRARLAGWEAQLVPDAVVRHAHMASTSSLPPHVLIKLTRTNRIRTIVKHASWPLLLRSSPLAAAYAMEVFVRSGMDGARHLGRAIGTALRQRKRLETMQRVSRRSVEREWIPGSS